jgi:hypothetical protein
MITKTLPLNPIGVTTLIACSDIHGAHADAGALAAFEEYLGSGRWDIYLNLGDLVDFESISSFSRDNPLKLAGQTIRQEFEAGNEILDRHQALVRRNNPEARFGMTLGNHCSGRLASFLAKNPQVRDSFDVASGLRLEERGFAVADNAERGEAIDVGSARFVHGHFSAGKFLPKNYTEHLVAAHGKSVFCGHGHDMSSTSTARFGPGEALVGQSIGCLCRYGMDYMKGRPSRWQHGFLAMAFMPDGSFTHYAIRISPQGTFVAPDGKVYGTGRART